MNQYSSNARQPVDSEQRIMDQYPHTPHDQGGKDSSSKGYLKGVVAGNQELQEGGRRQKSPPIRGKETIRTIRRAEPQIFSALLLLSRHKTIYLGYYGYGATKRWRYEGFKEGTMAALDKVKGQIDSLCFAILENMAYEGTIFASYDSLLAHVMQERGASV